MSHLNPGLLSAYNSLTDKHLTGYFNNTRIRRHLQRVGLISRSGRVVPDKEYRHKLVQRAHQRHVRECLAQAIFHKVLDMERVHQIEIKRKLEEFGRRERVHKIKVERSKRYEDDVIHILSPRPPARPKVSHAEGEQSESSESPGSSRPNTAPGKMQRPVRLKPITTASQRRRSPHRPHDSSNDTDQSFNGTKDSRRHLTTTEFSRGISPYRLPVINNFLTPVPPPPKRKERGLNGTPNGTLRGRRLRPTTAPSGPDITEDSPMLRTSVQSKVCVSMVYFGKTVHLSHDFIHMRDEVKAFQQHCGGENLCVFKGKLREGEMFHFVSRRHRGFPFSLTFFLNGLQVERISSCCEFKHRKGYRLGGRHGHFGVTSVEGASPCYRCIIAMGLDKKPTPPPKRILEDVGRNATSTSPQETVKDTSQVEEKVARKDTCSELASQTQDMETDIKEDSPPGEDKPKDEYEEDFEADDEVPAEDVGEKKDKNMALPSLQREGQEDDHSDGEEDKEENTSGSASSSDSDSEPGPEAKEDQPADQPKDPDVVPHKEDQPKDPEEVPHKEDQPKDPKEVPHKEQDGITIHVAAEKDKTSIGNTTATEGISSTPRQSIPTTGGDAGTDDTPEDSAWRTELEVLDTSGPSETEGKRNQDSVGAMEESKAERPVEPSTQGEEPERAKSVQEKLVAAILKESQCSSEPELSDTSTEDSNDAGPEKAATFTLKRQIRRLEISPGENYLKDGEETGVGEVEKGVTKEDEVGEKDTGRNGIEDNGDQVLKTQEDKIEDEEKNSEGRVEEKEKDEQVTEDEGKGDEGKQGDGKVAEAEMVEKTKAESEGTHGEDKSDAGEETDQDVTRKSKEILESDEKTDMNNEQSEVSQNRTEEKEGKDADTVKEKVENIDETSDSKAEEVETGDKDQEDEFKDTVPELEKEEKQSHKEKDGTTCEDEGTEVKDEMSSSKEKKKNSEIDSDHGETATASEAQSDSQKETESTIKGGKDKHETKENIDQNDTKPETKTDEVNRVKTDEVNRVKTDEVNRVKTDEVNRVKTDEVNRVKTDEVNRVKTDEVNRVKTGEESKDLDEKSDRCEDADVETSDLGEANAVKEAEESGESRQHSKQETDTNENNVKATSNVENEDKSPGETQQLADQMVDPQKEISASGREAQVLEDVEAQVQVVTPESLEKEDNRELVSNWVNLHQTGKFFEKYIEPFEMKGDDSARESNSNARALESPHVMAQSRPESPDKTLSTTDQKVEEGINNDNADTDHKDAEPITKVELNSDTNTNVKTIQSDQKSNDLGEDEPSDTGPATEKQAEVSDFFPTAEDEQCSRGTAVKTMEEPQRSLEEMRETKDISENDKTNHKENKDITQKETEATDGKTDVESLSGSNQSVTSVKKNISEKTADDEDNTTQKETTDVSKTNMESVSVSNQSVTSVKEITSENPAELEDTTTQKKTETTDVSKTDMESLSGSNQSVTSVKEITSEKPAEAEDRKDGSGISEHQTTVEELTDLLTLSKTEEEPQEHSESPEHHSKSEFTSRTSRASEDTKDIKEHKEQESTKATEVTDLNNDNVDTDHKDADPITKDELHSDTNTNVKTIQSDQKSNDLGEDEPSDTGPATEKQAEVSDFFPTAEDEQCSRGTAVKTMEEPQRSLEEMREMKDIQENDKTNHKENKDITQKETEATDGKTDVESLSGSNQSVTSVKKNISEKTADDEDNTTQKETTDVSKTNMESVSVSNQSVTSVIEMTSENPAEVEDTTTQKKTETTDVPKTDMESLSGSNQSVTSVNMIISGNATDVEDNTTQKETTDVSKANMESLSVSNQSVTSVKEITREKPAEAGDTTTQKKTETTDMESLSGSNQSVTSVKEITSEKPAEDRKDGSGISEHETTVEELTDLLTLSKTEEEPQEYSESPEHHSKSEFTSRTSRASEDTKDIKKHKEQESTKATEVTDLTIVTPKPENDSQEDQHKEPSGSRSGDKELKLIETLSKDGMSTFSVDESAVFSQTYPLMTTARTESGC